MKEAKNKEIPAIPTVLKTNTPMMLLQIAWKCPNCGGRAETSLVTTDQSDQATKNFVGAYTKRKWCVTCYARNHIRILDEVPVMFMPENTFVRWARGLPEKTLKGERVPEGRGASNEA